jgi:hypothetical protein
MCLHPSHLIGNITLQAYLELLSYILLILTNTSTLVLEPRIPPSMKLSLE